MGTRLPDPDVSYVSPSPNYGTLATTGVDGFTLVNGTPVIMSYDIPDDGVLHTVKVSGVLIVTEDATGGAIAVSWTLPDGTSETEVLDSSGHTAGQYNVGDADYEYAVIAKPGTTISVNQAVALSAGAAVFYGEIR